MKEKYINWHKGLFTSGMMLIACLLLSGCGKDYFNGSRVQNPDEYLLTFSYMNQEDSHALEMEEGDILLVEYEIEKGQIDVTIGIEGEESIYTGNDIETASFELLISKAGSYTISIDAKKAVGRMNFTVKETEESTETVAQQETQEIQETEEFKQPEDIQPEENDSTANIDMPMLDEINQNVQIGTAGAYMTAVKEAVRLLDWGVGTGLDPEEIRQATIEWLMNKGNDEQTEFAEKLRQVDDAYHKLLGDNAEDLLESAGCEDAAYPWSDVPVESIEAIMDAAGLRPYQETEENGTQTDDWKTAFEESLYSNYQVTVEHYEDLGDGVYQVYVVIDGKTVPYVTVDSKTGDYHG